MKTIIFNREIGKGINQRGHIKELSFTVPQNALTRQEQQKILKLQGSIAFLEQLDTLTEGTIPGILFFGGGGGAREGELWQTKL